MRKTLLPRIALLGALPLAASLPAPLQGTGRLPEETRLLRIAPSGPASPTEPALLARCAPKGTCPPLEADSKSRVQTCSFVSGLATGWRCLLMCNYSNKKIWATQVDSAKCK